MRTQPKSFHRSRRWPVIAEMSDPAAWIRDVLSGLQGRPASEKSGALRGYARKESRNRDRHAMAAAHRPEAGRTDHCCRRGDLVRAIRQAGAESPRLPAAIERQGQQGAVGGEDDLLYPIEQSGFHGAAYDLPEQSQPYATAVQLWGDAES